MLRVYAEAGSSRSGGGGNRTSIGSRIRTGVRNAATRAGSAARNALSAVRNAMRRG